MEKQIVPEMAAWKCGNVDLIERIMILDDVSVHPEFSQFVDKLVYKRNEKMADKISVYLKDNRDYFVVFGCAHTVGSKGVIALLKKKGFSVEQL
jgi:uncharacterized protein YbaP (TraB family)